MIYEYPEKFVVPVVYVDDLKEKSINRDWDVKYFKVEKLIVPDKKMQEENMSKESEYESGSSYKGIIEDEEKKYLKLGEDLIEKPYHEDMYYDNEIKESLENDDVNGILKDIDDDYANSETLSI